MIVLVCFNLHFPEDIGYCQIFKCLAILASFGNGCLMFWHFFKIGYLVVSLSDNSISDILDIQDNNKHMYTYLYKYMQ